MTCACTLDCSGFQTYLQRASFRDKPQKEHRSAIFSNVWGGCWQDLLRFPSHELSKKEVKNFFNVRALVHNLNEPTFTGLPLRPPPNPSKSISSIGFHFGCCSMIGVCYDFSWLVKIPLNTDTTINNISFAVNFLLFSYKKNSFWDTSHSSRSSEINWLHIKPFSNQFSEKTNVAKVKNKSLQTHSFLFIRMLFFASASGWISYFSADFRLKILLYYSQIVRPLTFPFKWSTGV